MQLCTYYQAQIKPQDTWFVTSVLRSFEHLAFDRTLDVEQGIFEFFVPAESEKYFEDLMFHFEQLGIVSNLQKLSNRLIDPNAGV